MHDSRQDGALRSIIIHLAAFSFAAGFYISTKKFLDFAPTDPVAIGLVTIEAASKLQDYVRFAYFITIVPVLTLLFARLIPRIGRRLTRSVSSSTPPLAIVAFAAAPLVLSPFLYLTTYKELWSVLLPPLLSWMIVGGWVLHERAGWLRLLLRNGRHGTHALVLGEGFAILLFRYVATGERIAHIPSLLLETIFVILFLAIWWGTLAACARVVVRKTEHDAVVNAFDRLAFGLFPLTLLPIAAILPLRPVPAFLAFVFVSAVGAALFTSARAPMPPGTTVDRLVAWIAAPAVIFALSYASAAHISGWVDLFHQGETLGPASDYLRGKLPYTETIPLHGLLQDGLLDAWLMQWFGRSAEVAIARATILESFMLPAIWLLAWVSFRSWTASAASVLVAVVLAADNQRAVLEIVAVMFFVVAIRSSRRAAVFLAGAVSGVTLFFSLEIGMYCIIGAAASIAALFAIEPASSRLRSLGVTAALFVAGLIAGAFPFLWYLGSAGVLPAFFETTFVTVPGIIDATWSLPFPDLDDWFSKSFSEETLFQLAWHLRFVINGLVLGIAIVVLAKRALQRRITLDDRILAVLTAFAIVTQRSALGRADFYHQWFSSFLVSPILVALVWRAIRLDQDQPREVRMAITMTAVVMIPVVLTIFWAPYLLESRLEDTIEFRARRAGTAPDPAGEMSTHRIERVVAEIRARSATDEPIFDFSNQPAFYFFAERRNPTRFYQVPLMSPRPLQREVIRDLEADPPAVVIMSSPDNYDRFDAVTNRDRALIVASWIEHHYSPSIRIEGVDLWVPHEQDPGPWSPPDPLPWARDVALRPHIDGRLAFPSVGTVTGADGSRWSSDLFLHNPHDVPVGFRLRFVTTEGVREGRYSVLAGESARIADVAESFFGMPQQLGALWIIYDQTFPPAARVVTRRVGGSGRGIHATPMRPRDTAKKGGKRETLIMSGFIVGPDERANLSLVNFGIGHAEARVTILDEKGDPRGAPLTTRVEEEHTYMFVDLLDLAGTSLPVPGIVRVDVTRGTVGAQISILDPKSGSADVIPAVPIESNDDSN